MINKLTYEKEHIEKLQTQSKNDPMLIERTIFAFGLLEALIRVQLPFVFKGGTCLMLLLNEPKRLSTDIDIIVSKDIDIDDYISKASEIFPFLKVKEQIRKGKNNIIKRHFHFTYESPTSKKPLTILLDVLFQQNKYTKTVKKEIKNELLKIDEPYYSVLVPTAECILGDKLTAFAPHTTGILLGEDKDLEVMKQMFDCACLMDVVEDFSNIKDTYQKIAEAEIAYRGLNITFKEVLLDTINAAICLMSRGLSNPADYEYFIKGIDGLKAHIFSGKYSGEKAISDAAKIFYIATAILANKETLIKIQDGNKYRDVLIKNKKYSKISKVRKVDLIAHGYIIEGTKNLEEEI